MLYRMAVPGKYERYHFISGVDLPLFTQNEIHKYFNQNVFEYLHFTYPLPEWDYKRVSRYHFKQNKGRLINKLIYYFDCIQDIMQVDRFKKYDMQFWKGGNWSSLSHDAVMCLLENEKIIMKIVRWSSCADECYKQIILGNNGFMDKMYKNSLGKYSDLRYTKWTFGNSSPHILTMSDIDAIYASDCLFARKFDESTDKEIIETIVAKVTQ